MNAKHKEIIKSIVEAQLDLTFDSVGDEFFLLDGDITLDQTLELEKINLALTHLLFKWMNQNRSNNSKNQELKSFNITWSEEDIETHHPEIPEEHRAKVLQMFEDKLKKETNYVWRHMMDEMDEVCLDYFENV